MGVEKVELNTLLARSDFITLRVPLTDQTHNILSRDILNKTKKGIRIINCARGGLVDEAALAKLLKSGHVAGQPLMYFPTNHLLKTHFLIFQMWFAHPTWVLQKQKRKKM